MLEQLAPGLRMPKPGPAFRPRLSGSPLDLLWEGAATISLQSGAVLYSAGTRAAYAYRLLSGRVDIFRGQVNGNLVPFYHVGAGDYLVEAALGGQHDSSARCTTAGKAQRLPVAQFHALLRQDHILALALCHMLARDVSRLRHTCQQRGQDAGPLRERILAYVASNSDPISGTLELPYSLRAWALEFGVAHETLSRTLRRLHSEGLLGRLATRTFVNKVMAPG